MATKEDEGILLTRPVSGTSYGLLGSIDDITVSAAIGTYVETLLKDNPGDFEYGWACGTYHVAKSILENRAIMEGMY
jgi:hypothetical protein